MPSTKNSKKPSEPTIDLTDEETMAFIDDTRAEFIQQRDRLLSEGNETERAACSQLMLVSTVLLSATVIVLSNSDLLRSMTNAQKTAMLLGVASLIGSIAAGIKYYFVLLKFHFDWAKANNEVANLHSLVAFKTFKEAREKADAILTKQPEQSPTEWLHRQIGLLGAGGGFYFLLLLAVLFNFGFATRHLPTWMR